MKILSQTRDMETGDTIVLTDASPHPVRVPADQCHGENAWFNIRALVRADNLHRLANRLFGDNRHDHFKGFRA